MEATVVQEENQAEIKQKTRIRGKVIKTTLAGAVIDIGTPQPAVIHISQILPLKEGETVKRVDDVLQPGQEIEAWVRRVKGDRIELTMVKPLELEWRDIKKGMTVKGTVVRMEKFGAFIEIGAERPGLVHISEMAHGYVRTPEDAVKPGEEIEAEVIEVIRRKKQIKLSMKALQPEPEQESEIQRPALAPAGKDKTGVRSHKPSRKPRSHEAEAFSSSQPEAEPEPTFMEIAMR
ncbi:MAG: S1 RNA-binding domain-containing protein, partial [Desulfuromonadales bacterium]|nr:S1 RNA-binding domain-containing protein [Desulfuromonadales bacterium]